MSKRYGNPIGQHEIQSSAKFRGNALLLGKRFRNVNITMYVYMYVRCLIRRISLSIFVQVNFISVYDFR